MPSIVQLNVSQAQAPTPNKLQQTGALISQGATTLGANTYALLTQDSSLTTILAPPLALSGLVWSAGTVLATASAVIAGLTTGDTFITTVAGAAPAGYNGTFLATVTGTTTFTYALSNNPGNSTVSGTFTPGNQGELAAMVGSFYSQGSSQAVYVLELGPGDATTGPAALSAFTIANPNFFYSFLVPRSWDASAGLLALIAANESLTAKLEFFVTTTLSTYTAYTALMNDVVWMVEAPNLPLTEFSLATAYYKSLAYNPSSANRMTPFNLSYLYGVTAYPQMGNNSVLTAIANAGGNVVGTGAEGGISNTLLQGGTTADGRDFSYWYSVDWIQINEDLNLANAVINGANNPANPLYYNQDGINRLQDVAVATVQNAITYGLATGTVTRTNLDPVTFAQNLDNGVYAGMNVVNAVPFATYVGANPSSYKEGDYGGFTCVYIPSRPFGQIVFNLLVTDLVASQ